MPSVMLKASGLHTFYSELGSIPEGSLLRANNVVIDKDGVIEPRRGLPQYGNTFGAGGDRAKQLFSYKGRILRHYGTTLQYDSNGTGTFQSFSGTFTELSAGLRLKGTEANSNFYFTSNEGIKKISASSASQFVTSSGYIVDAGGPKALDLTATANYSTAGFFSAESKVAYRIVWGYEDINKNLIIGSPSSRAVVANTSLNTSLPERTEIDVSPFGGAVPAGLYGTYFFISSANNVRKYMVFYSNGTTTQQPSGADTVGTVPLRVDISAAVTETDVAELTAIKLSETGDFDVSNTSTVIEVINVEDGSAVDASDSSLVGTTFSFTIVQDGEISDGQSAVVDLSFPVPADVTNTNFFYQVYRTAVFEKGEFTSLDDVDPGDEMNLVVEDFVTSAQLISKTVTLTDITPEDFRQSGTLLYTNPVTGAGISQSNDKPPLARDIALFNGSLFYANTSTRHQKELSLLSVDDLEASRLTVSAISMANPTQITTTTSHGLTTGQKVYINNSNSTPSINGEYTVTVVNGTNFTIPVNVTSAGSFAYVFPASLKITDGTTTTQYYFVGSKEETEITTVDFATITDTSYFLINSANNLRKYVIWYDKTGSSTAPSAADTVGRIFYRVDISSATTATDIAEATVIVLNEISDFLASNVTSLITVENTNNGITTNVSNGLTSPGFTINTTIQGDGENTTSRLIQISALDTPAQQVDETARSLVKVVNAQSSEIVNAFYLSGPDDVPGLMLFERKSIVNTTFYFTVNSVTVGEEFSPSLPTTGQTVISDNQVNPNRVYFSKYQQPEAVPALNFLDIGKKDSQILRILALRDGLFVLKEDGIFRITGIQAPNFSVNLFDNTNQLAAPDTAMVLNNQIYMLSRDGVSTVADTGVAIISRPIENKINEARKPGTVYRTVSFGVSYESDKSYMLWTVQDETDTVPTICYRFNTFTRTWVEWQKSATCGLVEDDEDRLYIGPGDQNFIEKERKSLSYLDYADREFSLSIPAASVDELSITISSTTNTEIGDVIAQTQYVTIYQFNQLLKRLDRDTSIVDTNYYSTLALSPGDNLTSAMTNLVAKLNADAGTASVYSFSGSTDFATIQTEYNTMISTLNADSGVFFSDYKQSSGSITFRIPITSVDINTNIILIQFESRFFEGPVTLFKSIKTDVEWAPQHFGDPSTMKQVHEGTILFKNKNFSTAEVQYRTDLSPSYQSIDFSGSINGIWGNFNWGEQNWGGDSNSAPLRTLIPRDKQRCRYINPRFQHKNAFEKYELYGISLTARPVNTRAYK